MYEYREHGAEGDKSVSLTRKNSPHVASNADDCNLDSVRYITNILTFTFALYAAVYGVTYAYRLHHMVNGLCAWLFVLHLSNGPLAPAKLVPSITDVVCRRTSAGQHAHGDGRNTKKRP